ncbi:MAG: aldo/keto reductase [Armatimonadetes bacterium]|nr:aldo/keto reductase [Armatimonadota bacterium]
MQYARFGNTSMKVSRLCLGTMGFGGPHLPPEACARVVDEAIDHGVNLLDTAESYGRSEAILGEVLGEKRDRVFISTKVFTMHTRAQCGRNSRQNILRSAEDSLARLQTEYIDLYLLHHPDPDTPMDETLLALDSLVRSGKVRYVGCSNHYAWQVALMASTAAERGWARPMANQVCYNILDRPADSEFVPFARKLNIPIMAYSPLCGGLLSGLYRPGEPLPAGSAIESRFGGKIRQLHESSVVKGILEGLEQIAQGQEVSVLQLSLLWLTAKPYVGAVLVGGTRPEHFRPAYEIADRTLPDEVVAQIDALSQPQVYKPFRNQGFADAPIL